jgi:hypothetical protein
MAAAPFEEFDDRVLYSSFFLGVQLFVIIGFGMAQVEYTYFFPSVWAGFV